MKSKSYRYNGKTGLGVNHKFFKTLIKNKESWRGELNLPKPYNQAELAMLSKFIFGVVLSVRFEYHTDSLEATIKECKRYEDIKFERNLKLINLNKKDYILKSEAPNFSRTRDNKMILFDLRYFCNQEHNSYYDHIFNRVIFKSSYEVDSYFWRHCIGEVYCGGIGDSSYGQVSITSFKERNRLLNFINNPNQRARKGFIHQMKKLIELDKRYDEKSVEV